MINRLHASGLKTILITFLAVFNLVILSSATAQSDDCGTVMTDNDIRAAAEIAEILSQHAQERSNNTYAIPIVMHIVRQSNGTGGINPTEVADAIDSANVLFAPVNVSVYEFQPTNFIDEDYFYLDMSSGQRMDSLKRYDRVPQAVNIYWVPGSSGFPYCGLSSFTTSAVQGIIMSNNCGGTFFKNSTLVHEIGHYFNLYHTHETFLGTECPNGSNCATAGDLCCDTPADPEINGHVSAAPACVYDNYASPPGTCDATPYNPPVFNIMSYSRQSCRDELTPLQIQRFRGTLETLRPELSYVVNGVKIVPLAVSPLFVPLGTSQDSAIALQNLSASNVTIQSATTVFGDVIVTGGAPITLTPNASTSITFKYDAATFTEVCDLGVIVDTLVITASAPSSWNVRIPITVNIVYEQPTQSASAFGPACLKFNVPNTPGIGNTSSVALVNSAGNLLYDGSLLLGVVDGTDTTVYQDAFSQTDYLAADNYVQGTDAYGRTTQTLRFTTIDARLSGELIYHYGWSTMTVDSCTVFEVEYRVRNECDTTLKVAGGMFGDFDLVDAGSNSTLMLPATDAIIATNLGVAAGFCNLTPCQSDRGLHPISNPISIYGANQLRDGEAYSLLVGPNGTNFSGTDVSVLLSFGSVTLVPGGERTFRAAIGATTGGAPPLNTAFTNLRNQTGSSACIYEVPSDYPTIQSAINAAGDSDTVVLAPGTYSGAGNVDLDFQGKKVSLRGEQGMAATIIDCGGSSGSPHRAMKFDSASEDSTIIIEGITIRNGFAPSDAPLGQPHGGAILIMSSAGPTFRNCKFEDNVCNGSGGAIAMADSSGPMKIQDCEFVSNSASNVFGGAIKIGTNSNVRISGSLFTGNYADGGGAVAIDNFAVSLISNCRFTNNQAQYGGAALSEQAPTVFSSCQFDRNSANLVAGVCYVFSGPAQASFINCTLFGNSVPVPPLPQMAGMLYADNSTINLQNCIVAYNSGDHPLICPNGGVYNISCTDIFGNSPGDWVGCIAGQNGISGNISLNPQFCDTANTDLRISSLSPCAPANNSCAALMGSGTGSCGNTPSGSNVEVVLSGDLSVTFANVSQDGETSLTTSNSGPTPPGGFDVVPSNPKVYYDLSTTASFTGDIQVCIAYDPSDLGSTPESELKLFHRDGTAWVDITESVDESGNLVCGLTDHFSKFILAAPAYQCGDADATGIVTISDAVYLIVYIFSGGPAPSPESSGDADCSGIITISDVVYLINYIFAGGPQPCQGCP